MMALAGIIVASLTESPLKAAPLLTISSTEWCVVAVMFPDCSCLCVFKTSKGCVRRAATTPAEAPLAKFLAFEDGGVTVGVSESLPTLLS